MVETDGVVGTDEVAKMAETDHVELKPVAVQGVLHKPALLNMNIHCLEVLV